MTIKYEARDFPDDGGVYMHKYPDGGIDSKYPFSKIAADEWFLEFYERLIENIENDCLHN